jgi:glycosyltransferase involved in cell wall biosynthesis
VENGNLDMFVQKMELLIEDENLRIQMGKNAKNSVSKYDLETIMQQWKSLFEHLAKNNSIL